MHEVELGVWKALFIHLLRILESVNENLLHELDKRSVNIAISASFYMSFDFLDFAWYQLLAEIQLGGLPRTHLTSKRWLLGITRIYFKFVSFCLHPISSLTLI